MTNIATLTAGTLIAADKVEGTAVYNMLGEKLGKIDDVLIDKVSGRAIYAVLSFGGFLGMNTSHHPMPWSTLRYDDKKSAYIVDLDKKRLEGAPNYAPDSDFAWTPDYGRRVDDFYKSPSNWA